MTVASQRTMIAGLLDQLATLGNKRTGMPIDADEWNALIDTVRGTLEVAAAQDDVTSAALDHRYAAADHEHLAEVTSEWLDADLRNVTGAGGPIPSVTGAVAGAQLGSRVDRLLDEVGRVRLVLEDQQARIDRSLADDLDRTNAVGDLREQVGTVNELRGAVTRFERRLRGTTKQIEVLEGLRASLTDAAGQTIDVGALAGQVGELGRLRENLTDELGNLVRMRDVLASIEEVRVTGPAGGDLDERFGVLRGELAESLDQRLAGAEERLNATADDRIAQTRSDLLAQLDQSLTSSRAELQQFADTRVAAAEQLLGASITTAVQGTAAALRDELSVVAAGAVQAGLGDVDARITTAVDAARAQVDASLRAELTAVATETVDERVGAVTAPLSERVADLGTRMDGIDASVDASVGAAVDARTDQLVADLDSRTSVRIEEARLALSTSIGDEVGRAVADRVGDIDALVAQTVDRRLADVDVRIDRRVAVATAALPDTVAAEVKTQIADLDVSGQLSAFETRITTSYRAEIAAAETRIESRRSSAINDMAIQLRSESQAISSGIERRFDTQLATQRRELAELKEGFGRTTPHPTRPPVGPVR